MDKKDKKILNIITSNEIFVQVKNTKKKSVRLDYNKDWKEKLTYPCGTPKKYDLVSLQNREDENDPVFLIKFAGFETIKEKTSWLKTEKYFKIKFGEKQN